MAVIQYKDKFGNVRTVNSIKGDRGPKGPRGPVGATGPTGPKGGTLIRGSFPTLNDLKAVQHRLDINIGDGYLIEDEEALYIWDGYKWVKSPAFIPLKLDHLVDVFIPETSLKHGDILVYDGIQEQWVSTDMEVAPGYVSTTKNITVTVEDGLGGYEEGEVIPIGTRYEKFVEELVSPVKPPEYIMPTLSINTDLNRIVSRGESLSPVILVNYKPNDAGHIRHSYLYRDDQRIDTFSAVSDRIYTGMFTINKDTTFKLEIYYEEGEVKKNSEGELDSTGIVRRGMIEATATIKCGTPYWGYTDNIIGNVSPFEVLNLPNNGYNLTSEEYITAIANENTTSVKFVYPKSLGPAKSISYIGFDDNSIDIFNRYEVQIFSKNYSDPIPYYVYQYNAPIEIGYAKFILRL